MSKDTKTVTAIITLDCWKELNVLRYRKNYKNLAEVITDILQNHTNKIINKENNNSQ